MQVAGDPVLASVAGPSPGTAVVTNAGPSTVYYAASQAAAKALNTANSGAGADGSVAPGASVTLSVSTWFVCLRLGAASLDVRQVTQAVTSSGVGSGVTVVTFDQPGTIAVGVGKGRVRVPTATTIVGVAAVVNTAPTGAAILVDVNKNGTTIFTTQGNRPTVAISGTASADAFPDVTALAAGDYLSVDIDQVGATVAGADLTVIVEVVMAAPNGSQPSGVSPHTQDFTTITGVATPAQVGTGTRDGTKFLRDDGTWQAAAGGGGASSMSPEPAIAGYKQWSYDSAALTGSADTPAAGVVEMVRLWCPNATTLVGITTMLSQLASAEAANVFQGIYVQNGANLELWSKTADVSAAFKANFGPDPHALTAEPGKSLSLAAGAVVYGAVLEGTLGVTPAFLYKTTVNASNQNGATSTTLKRAVKFGSGLTALPATIATASLTSATFMWWMATT